MHATIELVVFWALAFLTLCVALVLLSIFDGLIENDLELHSLGRDAAIAGVASLIEALGVWLVVLFIPALYRGVGLRAMIVPAIIVALIYKIAHLEDWSRYDVILLLVFQVFVGYLVASLILGHFEAAIFALAGFGIVLAVIAGLAKGL
jgi:hypothetical protein